ncbi:uncharacterized protein LOC111565470 isoform X6 [Amphiprion ocellaris]|uniref:uncharacterized protein LOC111565470 isoform X6 n=1 Tax=Amphiprion ocellaris TaxID=80972 RepID=UPI002410DDD8|nr:uncharacterized protein LOC111565470 isoform X6 [Amphiprion ocellaris]
MRDNLIFSGIPESTPDNPETLVKNFMVSALKIPAEAVKNITFHRVHRLGPRGGNRHRPIIKVRAPPAESARKEQRTGVRDERPISQGNQLEAQSIIPHHERTQTERSMKTAME